MSKASAAETVMILDVGPVMVPAQILLGNRFARNIEQQVGITVFTPPGY